MDTGQPCGEQGCRSARGGVRHNHRCNELNGIGETCWTCKVADWEIWYGGTLPAMIRCNQCGKGFNLSERLRATTKLDARGADF